MSVVLTASFSVMAQDTVKKDKTCDKQKTECPKACTKEKKENCDKAKSKECCDKANKDTKCPKGTAEKKGCCTKNDKKG